jgi:WhiB family transcriptional regulator, redox-sensing transcriptional regulator
MPTTAPPTAIPAGSGWQRLGRCDPATAELFYPPDHREPIAARAARVTAAKAICRRCPVLLTCRAHATATGEPHGIWGGQTAAERRRARRAARPNSHPARGEVA